MAATRDMKARYIRFFGEEYADRLTFRTINGLCSLANLRPRVNAASSGGKISPQRPHFDFSDGG